MVINHLLNGMILQVESVGLEILVTEKKDDPMICSAENILRVAQNLAIFPKEWRREVRKLNGKSWQDHSEEVEAEWMGMPRPAKSGPIYTKEQLKDRLSWLFWCVATLYRFAQTCRSLDIGVYQGLRDLIFQLKSCLVFQSFIFEVDFEPQAFSKGIPDPACQSNKNLCTFSVSSPGPSFSLSRVYGTGIHPEDLAPTWCSQVVYDSI